MKLLDPFAGGGSIPLEALRLGCETYASDYNPVATLILKCTLEYPQKYAPQGDGEEEGILAEHRKNRLVDDVRKLGAWVREEVRKQIDDFYPKEKDGSSPIGYLWARTIPCQNPVCNSEVPLMRQYWLANKPKKKIALLPYIQNKQVRFKIVGPGHEPFPDDFDPEKGTISRAVVACLACGSVIDPDTTRSLFVKGKTSERMIAVILHPKDGGGGKRYRLSNNEDLRIFRTAELTLVKKREKLLKEWGIEPVPDESTPVGKGSGAERAFSVQNYNLNTWGDLFNARQKLALITFAELVRDSHRRMVGLGYDGEYAKAVACYLGFNLDRLVSYCSNLGYWHASGEKISPAMQRQTLSMVFDYVESNPFAESFSWDTNLDWILRVIDSCSRIPATKAPRVNPPVVTQASATSLPFPDNYFDAVVTDPPYYDNVPYSYLSDFFYVWLKRTLGSLFPDLFATPLAPKQDEIVAYSNGPGGFDGGKRLFEERLKKSFVEVHRTLKPDGVAVIVYAHKSTAGWETLINSLLDSGLVVTAAWPVHTEMEARLRSHESAALASSIYMVTRKSSKEKTGFYLEIKQELIQSINKKLEKIWNEGISGSDFLIAAIGASIEVFGKYQTIIDDEGNIIRADRLLEDVRRIVTDFAVRQVLHNGFAAEISPMTRFYILWRWAYGEGKIDFDEARKLAQSIGIDLGHEWNKGFIRKSKEFIEVLGPEDRDIGTLVGSSELIDVLHMVLLFWKKGKTEDVLRVLKESGYGGRDVFYRVGQAISESLPEGSAEKKLLEGFIAGKERFKVGSREETAQTRLFE